MGGSKAMESESASINVGQDGSCTAGEFGDFLFLFFIAFFNSYFF